MARTKENEYLPRYYTNNSIRLKIDKALQEINESIMPNLMAIDCSEKESKQYKRMIKELEKVIKETDSEFYELTYLLDK